MQREVAAPDGRTWRVSRKLRWPRWRDSNLEDFWGGDAPFWIGGDDFALGGLLFGIVLFVVFGVLIVLLLPLLVFLAEALLTLGAVVVLRGTWVVEATTIGPPPEVRAWKVRGLLRSRRAFDEVVGELRRGIDAAPAEGEPYLR